MGVGEPHLRVALLAEEMTDRRDDLGRRQHCGGDLVQEGLEEMVVGTVDDDDGQVRARQGARGAQTAEAGADDHHATHARHTRT